MPRRNRSAIEAEMQARGLTAPAVTKALIESKIKGISYYHFEGTTVTVCLLTLENGFTVLGESACASKENFREDLGRNLALEDAKDKIWKLEGYLLRQNLFMAESMTGFPPGEE